MNPDVQKQLADGVVSGINSGNSAWLVMAGAGLGIVMLILGVKLWNWVGEQKRNSPGAERYQSEVGSKLAKLITQGELHSQQNGQIIDALRDSSHEVAQAMKEFNQALMQLRLDIKDIRRNGNQRTEV